jgi:hypothetical protein
MSAIKTHFMGKLKAAQGKAKKGLYDTMVPGWIINPFSNLQISTSSN